MQGQGQCICTISRVALKQMVVTARRKDLLLRQWSCAVVLLSKRAQHQQSHCTILPVILFLVLANTDNWHGTSLVYTRTLSFGTHPSAFEQQPNVEGNGGGVHQACRHASL